MACRSFVENVVRRSSHPANTFCNVTVMCPGRPSIVRRASTRSYVVASRRRVGVLIAFVIGALGVGVVTEPALEARVPGGVVTEVQVTGRDGIPADATAVAINLAAVDPADAGYLSAFPCGAAVPSTSTV